MHETRRIALLKAVETRRDEVATLTRDLVRFPTVNPPGAGYEACARFIGETLEALGFTVEYVRAAGAFADCDQNPRVNVIGRREGRQSGPCVHFNSHFDVVPTGEGWTVDPYGGDIRDGKVFGRGACDMKGGLASSIVAAAALLEVWPDFPGAIEISGTVDEESGGHAGVAYLAENGYFSAPRVDHVIIPEPFSPNRICLGHRGVWWAEITTFGTIAHGSMPFLGDCAVRHMGAVMDAFERDLFPALGQKSTAMPVTPQAAQCSTLNINSVHGGQPETFESNPAPNVPDICRMVIDRRFLVEERLGDVKTEIVAILDRLTRERAGFRYAIQDMMTVEPILNTTDAPVVRATQAAIRETLGQEPALVASPGTYDHKHVARIGGITDCIAYGPGTLEVAHQVDEFVAIDDLVDAAKVMAVAACNLLNGST